MEAVSQGGQSNINEKDLLELLQVFGDGYTLEDIASAYCEAKQNKEGAAEILSDKCGTYSMAETTDNLGTKKETSLKSCSSRWDDERSVPKEWSPNSVFQNDGRRKALESKPKKCSASMGTVSGIIGKEYVKDKPSSNAFVESKKPLKLHSTDFPASELWGDEDNATSITGTNEAVQDGLEDFLFQMLGEGFQLDMNVIQEVLCRCGYDMQKSIDKLLDLSASAFEAHDDMFGTSTEPISQNSDHEFLSSQEERQLDFAQSNGAGVQRRCSVDSGNRDHKADLEKEVLEALFAVPERSKEPPKRIRLVRAFRKSRAFGKPVVRPLSDTDEEPKPAKPQSVTQEKLHLVTEKEAEDEGKSYDVLRMAVREHWTTMREYYKSAVVAFMNGDQAKAQKLLQQGHFFNQKAREADEKSCQMLIESKCGDDEEDNEDTVLSLDLHGFEPKESLRLLRMHLTSVSGIPAIKYLRVILQNDEEDCSKEARQRLVLKQLEKESIKWTEEANGRIIVIRVDTIDPKCLSFGKKYGVGDHTKRLPKYGNSSYYI